MDDVVCEQQVKSLKSSSGNTRTKLQSLMIHLEELFKILPTTNAIILRFQNIKIAVSCLCTCVLEEPHNAYISVTGIAELHQTHMVVHICSICIPKKIKV